MLGEKIDVNGVEIHFEKVGTGSTVILLLPGGIGTSRTDYAPQLEQLSKSKYTLIAWDPPGYGFSRPPQRVYKGVQTFHSDAELAAELMQKLGYSYYSILGWSDGAKTALLMATKFQPRIDKLVVWGGSAYITQAKTSGLSATEDTAEWSDVMKKPYVDVYGAETFQTMWSRHIEFYRSLGAFCDICKDKVFSIRSPTLILHGDRDPLCPADHLAYLEKNIPDSRVYRFPQGGHNIHHVFAKEFNHVVENFLEE